MSKIVPQQNHGKKYVRISARIAQRISKLTGESHCAELTAEDPAAGEGPALQNVGVTAGRKYCRSKDIENHE